MGNKLAAIRGLYLSLCNSFKEINLREKKGTWTFKPTVIVLERAVRQDILKITKL